MKLLRTAFVLLSLAATTQAKELAAPHLALAGLSQSYVQEAASTVEGPLLLFGNTPGSCISNSATVASTNPLCPWQVVVTRGAPLPHQLKLFCEDGCDGWFNVTVLNEFIQPVDKFQVLMWNSACAQSHFGGIITCPNGEAGPSWSVFCSECFEEP